MGIRSILQRMGTLAKAQAEYVFGPPPKPPAKEPAQEPSPAWERLAQSSRDAAAKRDAAIRAAGLRETDDETTQVERFAGGIILHEVPEEHAAALHAVGFVAIRGGNRRMVWEEP